MSDTQDSLIYTFWKLYGLLLGPALESTEPNWKIIDTKQ